MQLFAHIVRESALGIEGGQVSGGHPTTFEHQGFKCAPGISQLKTASGAVSIRPERRSRYYYCSIEYCYYYHH
jgi:hypothetical protein